MNEHRLTFVLVNWALFTGVFWLVEITFRGVAKPLPTVDLAAIEAALLALAVLTEAANRRCRRTRP